MESQTVMESIIGPMEVILKEVSKMVFEMDREYGKKVQALTKNMKVSIQMTKKKVTEFLLGWEEMYTKEIM